MESAVDLLSKPANAFDRPKPLPAGKYICALGQSKQGKSKDKQTPYVEFDVSIIGPHDNSVDANLLNEIADWQQRKLRLTFYITQDSLWRLRGFIEQFDKNMAETMPIGQAIGMLTGRQFIAQVKLTPSKKGDTMFNEIDDTAPLAA